MASKQPLAEVFGFPIDNLTSEAQRYRVRKLCPYNNKTPNCTKDKAENPLGVCSVFEQDHAVVTCPIRFRQNWLVVDEYVSRGVWALVISLGCCGGVALAAS